MSLLKQFVYWCLWTSSTMHYLYYLVFLCIYNMCGKYYFRRIASPVFYFTLLHFTWTMERKKVLRCYVLAFTDCFCRKTWKPKKCSVRAWISVPEGFPRWFTQGIGFFSFIQRFPFDFTYFLSLLAICVISTLFLMNFFFTLKTISGIYLRNLKSS